MVVHEHVGIENNGIGLDAFLELAKEPVPVIALKFAPPCIAHSTGPRVLHMLLEAGAPLLEIRVRNAFEMKRAGQVISRFVATIQYPIDHCLFAIKVLKFPEKI